MIRTDQDETAVSLSNAVIYKAISKAELSVRMQRDYLLKKFAAEAKAMIQKNCRKKYIANTHFIWRIGHFLNGERAAKIRNTKLTAAEVLASENQALIACTDMSVINENIEIGHKLKMTIHTNVNRKSLNLPVRYLKFVMTFNPEAFEAPSENDATEVKTEDES